MLRFRFGYGVMGCQVQIQFTLIQKPLGVTLSSREPLKFEPMLYGFQKWHQIFTR
jgi:hypothetical protein